MFAQVEMLSKTRITDRIAILLARLDQLVAREGRGMDELRLSHADIAGLIAADRVSVTRALRKMEEDGQVSLGYRSRAPPAPQPREKNQKEKIQSLVKPPEQGGEGGGTGVLAPPPDNNKHKQSGDAV